MIFLYFWLGSTTADLCLDDTYEVNLKYWKKLGPFKSNEEAKNSWILLGRKTELLLEGDFEFRNFVGIKSPRMFYFSESK